MIATVTQAVRERMGDQEKHRFALEVRSVLNSVGLARAFFVSAGDGVTAVAWRSPAPVPLNTVVAATVYLQGRDFVTSDEYPRFILDATFRRATGVAGLVSNTDVAARAPGGVTAALIADADSKIAIEINDGGVGPFEWDIQVELR